MMLWQNYTVCLETNPRGFTICSSKDLPRQNETLIKKEWIVKDKIRSSFTVTSFTRRFV